MWKIFRHKQDETVEFEARVDLEDDAFYEVRRVGGAESWRVVEETFLSIYERKE